MVRALLSSCSSLLSLAQEETYFAESCDQGRKKNNYSHGYDPNYLHRYQRPVCWKWQFHTARVPVLNTHSPGALLCCVPGMLQIRNHRKGPSKQGSDNNSSCCLWVFKFVIHMLTLGKPKVLWTLSCVNYFTWVLFLFSKYTFLL